MAFMQMSMDRFEVKRAEVESFAKLHTIGGRHNGIHHQPEQGVLGRDPLG